jgi:hypothetical protein
MENLNKVWKEVSLKELTRMEPFGLEFRNIDFEVLNNALKMLYHIMGGKV